MFGRSQRRKRALQRAAERAVSNGPVDVEAIRSVIADVVVARPPRAAEVTEAHVRVEQYLGHPEHDLDCLRMHLVPRAAEALEVVIDIYEAHASVVLFVADDNPIELTAPININNVPIRPFLDVVREVLGEVSRGEVDVGRWPDGDVHSLRYWSEDGRHPEYDPDLGGIVWSAASAWD